MTTPDERLLENIVQIGKEGRALQAFMYALSTDNGVPESVRKAAAGYLHTVSK